MNLAEVGLAIALVALLIGVWALGRVSSYDGWIRRIEREGKESTARLDERINDLEVSMWALGDAIVERIEKRLASPDVAKALAQHVGVYAVAEIGEALADVKGNETLSAIGQRLRELSLRGPHEAG